MISTKRLRTVPLDPLIDPLDPRAMPLVEALKAIPGTREFEAFVNKYGVVYVLAAYGHTFRELAQFANKLAKAGTPANVSIEWGGIKNRPFVQISVSLEQMNDAIKAISHIPGDW